MSEEVTMDIHDLFNEDGTVDETVRLHMVENPMMYVYFDMEFTELSKNSQYISIGMCDAMGHSFYAEFNDYYFADIKPWVFENVLQKLVNPATVLEGDHWTMRGNSKEIAKSLLIWLDMVHRNTKAGIQFVTDCGHYDMVFLIDLLWGSALNMPEWINPAAVDINLDIANLYREVIMNKYSVEDGAYTEVNPYFEAFNMNRDEYASHIKNAPEGMKHNSMYDAYLTRALHQNFYQLDPGEYRPLINPDEEASSDTTAAE